jgi:hypothetical protein
MQALRDAQGIALVGIVHQHFVQSQDREDAPL